MTGRRLFKRLVKWRFQTIPSKSLVLEIKSRTLKTPDKAGLAAVYIRSNLSPAEPLPDADHVLEELDLRRVGDLLTGDGPA